MTCNLKVYDPCLGETEHLSGDNVSGLIIKALPEGWSWSYRIYHEICGDVTPVDGDRESFDRLSNLEGFFTLIKYPSDGISAIALVWIAINTAITAAAVYGLVSLIKYLTPKPPQPTIRGNRRNSSNNSLSERTNDAAEPGARIPDIFGEELSYPTLLGAPYIVYESNGSQREYSYMVVSRGLCEVSNLKDGANPLSGVTGYGAKVFGPDTSPNSGDPFYVEGEDFTEPVSVRIKSNDIVGQLLVPENAATVNSSIICEYPDTVYVSLTEENVRFSDVFENGDTVTLTMGDITYNTYTLNLSGTYDILTVSPTELVLSNPAAVNPDWNDLQFFPSGRSADTEATISRSDAGWIGPFILDEEHLTDIYLNLQAPQGLYKDDGKNQIKVDVTVELEATPLTAAFGPSGPAQTFTATVFGSAVNQDMTGATLRAVPTIGGRQSVRIRRVTPTDKEFSGAVVDKVFTESLYAGYPGPDNFGNMTTIQLSVRATNGAVAVKERKFNCKAIRKISKWDGASYSEELTASTDAAEIIIAVARDPYIGRLDDDEIDPDSILTAAAEVKEYLDEIPAEFNYTFDSMDLTFDDTVTIIANAAFSKPGRPLGKLTIMPDLAVSQAKVLFNHRNIIPESYAKTVRFGKSREADGVETFYKSLENGEEQRQVMPESVTPYNPSRVELPGIKRPEQVISLLGRAYNKLFYSNQTVEFESGGEAVNLFPGDKILVSRQESPVIIEGELRDVNGNILTLSQPCTLDPEENYIVFLQNPAGLVESVPVISQISEQVISIAAPLGFDLELANVGGINTTYKIVKEIETSNDLYVISSTERESFFKTKITAIKYDPRLYIVESNKLKISTTPEDFGYFRYNILINNATFDGGFYQGSDSSSYLLPQSFIFSSAYTKMVEVYIPDYTEADLFSSFVSTDERLFVSSLGDIVARHSGAGASVSAPIPALNTWFKIVVTYEDPVMKIYINGELISVNNSVLQRNLNSGIIGSYNGGNGFVGRIRNIRYFTRALSKDEIRVINGW